jgi:uncharacterized caspase-like protein
VLLLLSAETRPTAVHAGIIHPPKGSTLYVLAIGINKYQAIGSEVRGTYSNLELAVQDAKDLSMAFSTKSIKNAYGSVDVTTLLDTDATLAGARSALNHIAEVARPEDVVLLFFSGRGLREGEYDDIRAAQAGYNFFLSDSSQAHLSAPINNTLSARELSASLLTIQARRQIVILDTAYSSDAFESLRSALNSDSVFTLRDGGRRFALLGLDGIPEEPSGVQHGLLAAIVLDAMAGAADLNHDGVITEGELEGYTMGRLSAITDWDPFEKSPELVSFSDLRGLCLSATSSTDQCMSWYGYDPSEQISPKTRGVVAEEAPAAAKAARGTDYALILAGDTYDHWPKLSNPIYDAQTLKKELITNFGYAGDNVLYKENPTKRDVFDQLNDLQKRTFGPNDRLFIYIAGHGFMDGAEGFMVTWESQLPADDRDFESGLALSRLRDKIDTLKVPHILVVLDVCYGGVFKERKQLPAYTVENLDTPQSLDVVVAAKMKSVSRLYIASGGLRQAYDGNPGTHSPFARTFLKTLRDYGGKEHLIDMGRLDGAVYGLCPHPYTGSFGTQQEGGDFVFIPSPDAKNVPDPGLSAKVVGPRCSAE